MTPFESLVELSARLIVVFEGVRLQAYKDSGGVWTIGIGHTRTAKEGQIITQSQAVELYKGDAAPLIALVEYRPVFEAAALISFGFNCGIKALQRVLDGGIRVTYDGFMARQPEGGEVEYGIRDRKGNTLPGLVARRRLEAALIMNGGLGKGT